MEQQQNHRFINDGILLDDIMMEILSRLPVKSLLRFRSVCRHWKSLITSYSLRKLHRERQRSSPPLIITCHNSNYGIEADVPYMMEHYLTAFNLYGKFIQKYKLPTASECLSMINIPSQATVFCFKQFSFVFKSETLYLYNPSTRQYSRLPRPPCFSLPGFKACHTILGYNPSNDVYMLAILVEKYPLQTWYIEVLTFYISNANFQLHYNEWRYIEVTTMLRSNMKPVSSGVFVCMVFYWEACDEDGKECILSFDVETEVFSTIRLPQGPLRTLLELKDELYVMSETDDHLILKLWKLCTDDNDNKSWTIYKTFNLQNLGYTEEYADRREFDWKIFIYRLEYLQCYNEPSNVLLDMGMLKLEDDVVDADNEYFMPNWSVNIGTNLFTL